MAARKTGTERFMYNLNERKSDENPLQITFRDIERSDALETHIREKAEKLETFFEPIMSCRVVVEMPHQHKNQGKLFTCASTSGCREAKSW